MDPHRPRMQLPIGPQIPGASPKALVSIPHRVKNLLFPFPTSSVLTHCYWQCTR